MAVAYNYSSTAVATTLSGGIDGSATTVSVVSTSGFPAAPFKLTIDPDTAFEEIVKVTAIVGLALTVTRGHDGTVGLAHSAGAAVRHQATGEDLRLSRQHEDATANVHGVGVSSDVVGTTTVQTLEGKIINDAQNTLTVDQASVTGLVTALAALTTADTNINTNIDDWDADTPASVGNTDAPSTYPSGFSIKRILVAGGWPVDGWVLTFKLADNSRAIQFFGEGGTSTTTVSYYRHYNGTAWQVHWRLTNDPATLGSNWSIALAADLGSGWPAALTVNADQRIPILVIASDATFPQSVTDTTADFTSNRITIASVAYARLLTVTSHTFARYSQGQGVQADLFVNSTLIGKYRPGSSAVETYESYIPHGQFRLPASTAGVVEVRFTRIGGTGQYDVINTETLFQVSHQICV